MPTTAFRRDEDDNQASRSLSSSSSSIGIDGRRCRQLRFVKTRTTIERRDRRPRRASTVGEAGRALDYAPRHREALPMTRAAAVSLINTLRDTASHDDDDDNIGVQSSW
jgi:hypothetical protein